MTRERIVGGDAESFGCLEGNPRHRQDRIRIDDETCAQSFDGFQKLQEKPIVLIQGLISGRGFAEPETVPDMGDHILCPLENVHLCEVRSASDASPLVEGTE